MEITLFPLIVSEFFLVFIGRYMGQIVGNLLDLFCNIDEIMKIFANHEN